MSIWLLQQNIYADCMMRLVTRIHSQTPFETLQNAGASTSPGSCGYLQAQRQSWRMTVTVSLHSMVPEATSVLRRLKARQCRMAEPWKGPA